MGQSNSNSSYPERKMSFRKSLRSPFLRRSRMNQSLSATFNYVDPDIKGELLNVNKATAEELMTLPGVTRAVARSIVEHRQVIGGFHRVEDVALVTGVGADCLAAFRPEICVGRRKNNSNQSSCAQSLDSLSSGDARAIPLDANAAGVFALMELRGVSQELAANIVDHRDRRGPFNALDDLVKVRGMSTWLLSNLRSQLTVGPPPPRPGTPLPGGKKLGLALLNGSSLARIADRKPHIGTNGFTPAKDIFELLCAYSQRPAADDAAFANERDGRAALRLASWNLTAFAADKADNPGVREVVCRTLLENRFSLVATQEVIAPVALDKITSEMNCPKLRRVIEWKGKRGKWKSCTILSENKMRSCGFLYDKSTGISLKDVEVIHDSEVALAVLAQFSVDGAKVQLVNIHLSPDSITDCAQLCRQLLNLHGPDVILGDFSAYPEAEFSEEGYTRVLPTPTVTNSMAPGNCGPSFMDNIYLNKRSLSRYTGVSGIVRQGLCHVAIPRGWAWGGPASEHCPVWCELFT